MTKASAGLRVGLVCPYSFGRAGGVQNHVLGLAGWLQGQGHQPRLLAPGNPSPQAVAAAGLPASAVTSAGPGFPVPYNGSVARVNLGPVVARRVRRWLRDGDFDVVHVHEPMTPSISLLALAQSEQPVVSTFHTATPGSRSMELAYRVAPQLAPRITVPVAVSRMAREVPLRHGGVDARIIPNGIDLARHRRGDCAGPWRAGPAPRLAFVGRHGEPRKGFAVLLQALPVIRAHHPHLEVVVVGHGRRASVRPLPGVVFLGELDDAGRDEVLATTDVYVAPHTGRESFGIVLLEALASGAPVVASDLPAFRDVVSDDQGPVADLFTPGSPDALATAVLTSLARPRDAWTTRAAALAARFDWSQVGPQLEQAYREALAAGVPARADGRGSGTPIA